jgi:hypothetical protein
LKRLDPPAFGKIFAKSTGGKEGVGRTCESPETAGIVDVVFVNALCVD